MPQGGSLFYLIGEKCGLVSTCRMCAVTARRDLFLYEQGLDELVPEQLHEAERIGARDGNERSMRRNKAVGDQTVEMRMKGVGSSP